MHKSSFSYVLLTFQPKYSFELQIFHLQFVLHLCGNMVHKALPHKFLNERIINLICTCEDNSCINLV
jgi:hypothetical protein